MPSYVANSILVKRGGCGAGGVVVKGPPANGSMYPAKPPRAVVDAGTCKTVGWGAAVVKMGASAHDGIGDGEGGKRIWVIGTPCG